MSVAGGPGDSVQSEFGKGIRNGLWGPEKDASVAEEFLQNSQTGNLAEKKVWPVLRDGARAFSAGSSGLTWCRVSKRKKPYLPQAVTQRLSDHEFGKMQS